MKVLQIANYVDGVGGISVQVKALTNKLLGESIDCTIFSTKGHVIKRILAPLRLLNVGRDYDIYHIHACSAKGFFPAVIGITIGKILKKKIILTYHGGGAESFFNSHKKFVKFFLTLTDHNIVLSGFLAEIFSDNGIPCSIIPNIIEPPESKVQKDKKIEPNFICIRSFTETYNIKCLLKAFIKVKKEFPEAKLKLLGDGPLRLELESFVDNSGVKDVTFEGQVDNGEISKYLREASIMVSPSNFDNMPVSILEGMKAGNLIIASNVGGIPYMIKDGRNGLLFTPDNDNELARKMIWALYNNEESISIINNSFEDLKKYSWNEIKKDLFFLYNN